MEAAYKLFHKNISCQSCLQDLDLNDQFRVQGAYRDSQKERDGPSNPTNLSGTP